MWRKAYIDKPQTAAMSVGLYELWYLQRLHCIRIKCIDRPTDRSRILENFERPYIGNGWSDRFLFNSPNFNSPNAIPNPNPNPNPIIGIRRIEKTPILSMFGSRAGFSRSADRMSLFPVGPNPRSRPSAVLHNFELPCLLNGSTIQFVFG